MNWFDVVVALLFAAALAGGYFQGLIRQALSLGAVACGIVLATYLYLPLANWFAFAYPDASLATRETAALLLSLIALITALEIAQRKAVPVTRVLAAGPLDQVAGALVAIFTACLQISIGVLILKYLVTIPWPIGGTLRLFLLRGLRSSTLAPALYNLLVALVTVVGRLLPEGKPRFLTFM